MNHRSKLRMQLHRMLERAAFDRRPIGNTGRGMLGFGRVCPLLGLLLRIQLVHPASCHGDIFLAFATRETKMLHRNKFVWQPCMLDGLFAHDFSNPSRCQQSLKIELNSGKLLVIQPLVYSLDLILRICATIQWVQIRGSMGNYFFGEVFSAFPS